MKEGALRCEWCGCACVLAPGETGRCGVRIHDGSGIRSRWPDHVVALALDPVEKKPFFHAFPGAQVLSVALPGCNYRCPFCQNAPLSQPEYLPGEGLTLPPEAFAERVLKSPGRLAAYTYSEPTVWLDWVLPAARRVREGGGANLMVTNGSFSSMARGKLLEVMDGFNVDLKGDEAFYREQCSASRAPVLANLRALAKEPGVILEVTTLVIEGLHTEAGLDALAWELAQAGVHVWHLSAFHPAWRMTDRPRTSRAWLEDTVDRLRAFPGIGHVYAGNIPGHQDTQCLRCGHLLIRREGPGIPVAVALHLDAEGRCPACGETLYLRR